MAGIRRILTGLAIASAIISLPAAAQSSASLTHVVTVTVPARVKVQVASLSAYSPAAVRMSPTSASGLSVTVRASKAWVMSVTSASGAASKSQPQWSRDGNSGVATLMSRNAGSGEPIFLTVAAP